MFINQDIALDPFDRSAINGFRTVKYLDPVAPDVLAPVASLDRNFNTEHPVNDATYRNFLRMYAYDRTELRSKLESVTTMAYGRVEKVSFDAAYNNERVTASVFLPSNTDPPFQTVIYYPTAIPFFTPSSQQLETNYLSFVVRSGRAVVFPIYKGTYERMDRSIPYGAPPSIAARDLMVQVGKDLRRTIDHLQTRADIDQNTWSITVSARVRLGAR